MTSRTILEDPAVPDTVEELLQGLLAERALEGAHVPSDEYSESTTGPVMAYPTRWRTCRTCWC